MKKLFKDFEECKSVVMIMSEALSERSLIQIKLAINVCDSLMDDKDKIFRLVQSFLPTLWENDDAIRTGFAKYFRQEAKKVIEVLKYHEKHCPETGCVICNTIDNMKIKMRNTNERTRPELYS